MLDEEGTIIAVNLACVFAVPVVDADAQGTASAYGAPGGLPIEVMSLPLERERDASSGRMQKISGPLRASYPACARTVGGVE